jgi:uncharacterized protein with PIN domain
LQLIWRRIGLTFDSYSNERRSARLNFGDRFDYSCARDFVEPLMFKSADFPQIDIEAA